MLTLGMLQYLLDAREILITHHAGVLAPNGTFHWHVTFLRFRVRVAKTQLFPVRFSNHIQTIHVPGANLLHQIIHIIIDDITLLEEIRLRTDIHLGIALRVHVISKVISELRYFIERGVTDAADGSHFVISFIRRILLAFVVLARSKQYS